MNTLDEFENGYEDLSTKNEVYHIKSIPVVSGNPDVEMDDLKAIFSDSDIDSKELRKSAWLTTPKP